MNSNQPEPPDMDFEIQYRNFLINSILSFNEIEEEIRKQPEIDRFLEFKGGFKRYLIDLASFPDVYTYLSNIYLLIILKKWEEEEKSVPVQITTIITDLSNLREELLRILNKVLEGQNLMIDTLNLLNRMGERLLTSINNQLIPKLDSLYKYLKGSLTEILDTLNVYNIRFQSLEQKVLSLSGLNLRYFNEILDKQENYQRIIMLSIENIPTKVLENLEDRFKLLKEEISEEVSLKIVGESYYKWDSVTTYFPTLILLFKEKDVEIRPRKSQIKLRLKIRGQDLTNQDIYSLKDKILLAMPLCYKYGKTRGNYVSKDKRFKTTIFASERNEIDLLLNRLSFIIDEEYNPNNLSITQGRNRESITKRRHSLMDIEINPVNYEGDFEVCCFRAVLIVNGLSSPIVLYNT